MSDTLVFSFSRMNPPTLGHRKHYEEMVRIAKLHNADVFQALSMAYGSKKNPLPLDKKFHHARRIVGENIHTGKNNVIDWLKLKNSEGYKHLIFACGSDRIETFQNMIERCNGNDFKFDTIKMVSTGSRDLENGISASKVREVAAKHDFPAFEKLYEGIPTQYITELYIDLVLASTPINRLKSRVYNNDNSEEEKSTEQEDSRTDRHYQSAD